MAKGTEAQFSADENRGDPVEPMVLAPDGFGH